MITDVSSRKQLRAFVYRYVEEGSGRSESEIGSAGSSLGLQNALR